MKVTSNNILKLSFYCEVKDKERYRNASFYVDSDAGRLLIESDIGNFHLQHKTKDFKEWLKNLSEDDFLRIIARKSIIKTAASKRITIKNLKDRWSEIEDNYDDPSFALDLQVEAIQRIVADSGEDFAEKVTAITGGFLNVGDIAVIYDYPAEAKTIASIFENFKQHL